MLIIPAVLESNLESLLTKLEKLAKLKAQYTLGFERVHIDLADGEFVTNLTYLPEASELERISQKFSVYKNFFNLEYHLMCQEQLKYFKLVRALGANSVVLHLERILKLAELSEILRLAKESQIHILVTAKLDFLEKEKEKIVSFLKAEVALDLQIMGIQELGKQGQIFERRSLELSRFFRSKFKREELYIQIDGGVNQETILEIQAAGVDGVVVGSYLVNSLEEDFLAHFQAINL